ncbi:MAG TPA: hypothetical protein VGP69_07230, partial [Gaiellaceae bacterium]|nr:hypothetical protein [Gaiellaceae bacterium]
MTASSVMTAAAPSRGSAATPGASVRTSSVSTNLRAPMPVYWERLSPVGAATARRIAAPLSLGFTIAETVAPIGIGPSAARLLLKDLRA